MLDLRVTVAVDVLQVTRMGTSERVGYVRLSGPNLGTASEVQINSAVTTDIIVVSEHQIDVAVPVDLFRVPIRNVEVKSYNYTGRARANLEFELDPEAPTVEGLAKLVQNFVCLLYQTPGSDAFHQDEGGGLRSILGKAVDVKDRSTYATPIVTAVDRTRTQMQRSHAVTKVPLSERLRDVTITAINFVPATGSIVIELALTSMAGHTAVAKFGAPSPVT
jgi:hypothetical protein